MVIEHIKRLFSKKHPTSCKCPACMPCMPKKKVVKKAKKKKVVKKKGKR